MKLYLSPHYTDRRFMKGDAQTVYCEKPSDISSGRHGGDYIKGLHYDYSDRLWEWDPNLHRKSVEFANRSDCAKGSAEWIERFLSNYYGYPVTLRHVLAGVNVGNGYPYSIYGSERTEGDES
ncbi:MAG: hypothetical protein ACU843_17475 [Gammaproteobacteria bacterium]